MRWSRAGLVVVLAAVVVAGVVLAHASPPDPTWIAGLYDDADYDDVVLNVLAIVGTVSVVAFSAEPTASVELLALDGLPRVPTRHVAAPRSRAPPLPPQPA